MASFIRIIISSGILISFCEGKKHDLLTGLLKQFFKLLTMQRKTNLKCFIVVIDRAQVKGKKKNWKIPSKKKINLADFATKSLKKYGEFSKHILCKSRSKIELFQKWPSRHHDFYNKLTRDCRISVIMTHFSKSREQ